MYVREEECEGGWGEGGEAGRGGGGEYAHLQVRGSFFRDEGPWKEGRVTVSGEVGWEEGSAGSEDHGGRMGGGEGAAGCAI